MANGFVTDYSFLNLPEKGSAVRGPIELPSFEPVDYLSNIDFYAPRELPETELVAPSPVPLSEQENLDLLSQARPFEDIAALGAAAGQRMAEVEKFYGDQVNQLQGNIQELEAAKQNLLVERNDAIEMQDVIRQQLSEEKIQALNEQQARLQFELQQAVAEAEARGVNAVAAAERRAAEKLQQVTSGYEGQINEINQALANVTAERDQAIAEQDVIKAQAADEQAQALESQKQSLLSERQSLLGERESTIADLQAQISALQETPVETPSVPVETPSVISEQPETPFDQYLRDQEKRELTIDLGGGLGTVAVPLPSTEQLAGIAPQIPNQEAIQKGIEELYGRVTAGGGKPEDFKIYQPPAAPAPAPAPSAPPSGGKLYAGGSPGLYEPGGKFYSPRVELPFPPRPASPLVSQPPRTIPTTAPKMPIQGRPFLPIRPMGRFAGGGLVDMIQMRLNRI